MFAFNSTLVKKENNPYEFGSYFKNTCSSSIIQSVFTRTWYDSKTYKSYRQHRPQNAVNERNQILEKLTDNGGICIVE